VGTHVAGSEDFAGGSDSFSMIVGRGCLGAGRVISAPDGGALTSRVGWMLTPDLSGGARSDWR
jgi:hypothetical protein